MRTDLRYYVDLIVACALSEKPDPSVQEIAALGENLPSSLTTEVIVDALEEVRPLYEELGGTDKVSKGPELVARLKARIKEHWPAL